MEHFAGKVSIYLHDPEDVRSLSEHFPLLIAKVQRLCIVMIGKIGISRECRR
jgi:hypothetical protein